MEQFEYEGLHFCYDLEKSNIRIQLSTTYGATT
jgi:hypothetical protein